MKRSEGLEDFTESVYEANGEGQLFISQQESEPPEPTIGDEDSGESTAITIHALLEAPSGSVYFSAVYDDAVHYEEAIKQLQALENEISTKSLKQEEIEARKNNALS